MSRIYRVPMAQLSVSGRIDLWAITAGAGMPFFLEELRIDPVAVAVSEIPVSLLLFSGAFTAGSGGSPVTPSKSPGDIASVATAAIGNTTQTATGTGIRDLKDAGSWNIVNGWAWQPIQEDHRVPVPALACIVLSMDLAPPNPPISVSGCAIIREIF